jgi:diguanylate cyclase (GGDEF)-like protein
MDFSQHSKTSFAFGFSMLIMMLIGGLCYRWTLVSDESDRWVEHTHQVLAKIQDLELTIVTIESESHNFALTGHESDLKTYHATALRAKQDLEAIRDLTTDNPIQQQQLPFLADLLSQYIGYADMIVSLRQIQGRAAATGFIAAGQDQRTVDEIRASLGKLHSEEERLQLLRVTKTERYLNQTKRILVIGTLLGILVAGFAAWSTLRNSGIRGKAKEDLLQKVEEISRSNKELVRLAHEARAMTRQMTHSAEHDALTDLPNRLLLNDRIGQAVALAQRREKQVGVLYLDLDSFKHMNDSLGHPIGDKLLQSLARRLLGCVRTTDTVSRLGGDEFVILLSEIERPEDAAIISRKLLQAVSKAFPIDKHDLHITASIGVSTYPDDGFDAETLIKNADTAMFQAKENGREGYQFFRPAMNVRAVERQLIEEHLRRALERQEFALHYQPKIILKTGAISGVEALLRWTHPTRGYVPPGQFIPVAEDCGLILPIGAWVLKEACAQARAWADAGLPALTMAVNVSPVQFKSNGFLNNLAAILIETGLDPRSLELEVTEGALMKNPELAADTLSTLRGMGVQVAIDDFGTGYSSLSYLRRFPLDALKIDQSFIRQITTIPDETVIVSAIISMGQSLNLRIIAEGVETEDQLDFLKAHKCDEAQGFYFSRPVPPQQIASFLESREPIGNIQAPRAYR